MALASRLSIYDLVVESGKVVLAGAFVPLTAGLFWKRANERGSLAAVIAGIGVWLGMEALAPDGTLPPVLGGLLASAIGMAGGSLIALGGVPGRR